MNDEHYMLEALKQAKKAFELGEIPVGCVIVHNGKIIARAYNQRETKQKSSAHAEIIAIDKACKKLGSWRLNDCSMYVTLEPCSMCAGAIIQSRICNLYYGASNQRFGAHKSYINLFHYKFNHCVNVTDGILEDECSRIIKDFFKELRNKELE